MTYTDAQMDALADAVAECLAFDVACCTWEITELLYERTDAEGAHFQAWAGDRVVGVVVPPAGAARIEATYTHRVGLAERPADDDLLYTALAAAEVTAESESNGTERIYAVWDITDLYPRIVALAHHGDIYRKA